MEHIVYTCNVSFIQLKVLIVVITFYPFFTKTPQKIYTIFLNVFLNLVRKAVEYIIKGIQKKIKKFFHGFGKLVVWGQTFLYLIKNNRSYRHMFIFLVILIDIIFQHFN